MCYKCLLTLRILLKTDFGQKLVDSFLVHMDSQMRNPNSINSLFSPVLHLQGTQGQGMRHWYSTSSDLYIFIPNITEGNRVYLVKLDLTHRLFFKGICTLTAEAVYCFVVLLDVSLLQENLTATIAKNTSEYQVYTVMHISSELSNSFSDSK